MTGGQGKDLVFQCWIRHFHWILRAKFPHHPGVEKKERHHFSAVDAKVSIGLQQRVTNDTGTLEISQFHPLLNLFQQV